MKAQDTKNLERRYLVWFYKITKEALDKIERKFTQVEIDRALIAELKKADKRSGLRKFIAEFQAYVDTKEKDGLGLKFENKALRPEYEFLTAKLAALEKIIVKE